MIPKTTCAIAAAFFVALGASAAAQESIAYETLVTPLLATGETILGETIDYPSGDAKITAAIVTLPPGEDTGLHFHPVPLFAYILEGALTVDYGDAGTRTYVQGDSFMEAMNHPHNGTNTGDAPVRILAVYIGAEGVANATAVE